MVRLSYPAEFSILLLFEWPIINHYRFYWLGSAVQYSPPSLCLDNCISQLSRAAAILYTAHALTRQQQVNLTAFIKRRSAVSAAQWVHSHVEAAGREDLLLHDWAAEPDLPGQPAGGVPVGRLGGSGAGVGAGVADQPARQARALPPNSAGKQLCSLYNFQTSYGTAKTNSWSCLSFKHHTTALHHNLQPTQNQP